VGLFGTGVKAAGTGLVATNASDPNWWVQEPGSGTYVRPVRQKHTAYVWPDASPSSAWITSRLGGIELAPPGEFKYKYELDLTNINPNSFVINSVQWASDNSSETILINNNSIAGGGVIHTVSSPPTFSIGSTHFQAGTNELIFNVFNDPS